MKHHVLALDAESESLDVKRCRVAQSSTIGVGTSVASRDLRGAITRAAGMPKRLLIVTGDTGVEKNAVAEAVHKKSQCTGQFVHVNCTWEKDSSALVRFFGVANDKRCGSGLHKAYLEQAAGGTLILDNITELSRELQSRLLAFIDTGLFMKTRGVQPSRANVGVIGIARNSIQDALDNGSLSADFYYRLAQFTINVPRLQQRSGDKRAVAEQLLARINARDGSRKVLTTQAYNAIEAWHWPGNIQEMNNALHRACVESRSNTRITLAGLGTDRAIESQSQPIQDLIGKTFWQVEKELLYATLDHHGGDKEKSARMLGISLKTLYNRLHAYS